MNNLYILKFESKEIRCVVLNGAPWFVAYDVATALGYANATDAAAQYGNHFSYFSSLDELDNMKDVRIISERGVFRLIMGSASLPSSNSFEHWMFEKVLPSIRKTGIFFVRDDVYSDPALVTLHQFLEAASLLKVPDDLARIEAVKEVIESHDVDFSRLLEL